MATPLDDSLDPGIAEFVRLLHANGVETYESCEGGEGHAYPEPTIRFHGDRTEGFRAFAIAQQHGLPVSAIRRAWPIVNSEPTGPCWEITFFEKRLAVDAVRATDREG